MKIVIEGGLFLVNTYVNNVYFIQYLFNYEK